MKRQLLSILFLIFIGHLASAYEPIQQWMLFRSGYAFINSKVDKAINLSGTEAVNDIAQDGNGNIYLALGDKGIRIFDGKKLLAPLLPKDCFAYEAQILSLAVDSKNILWVGTSDGLVKYDGNTWINIPTDQTQLSAITDIAITASDKVYITGFASNGEAFTHGGLSFFNGSGWANFTKANTPTMPNDTLQDLTIDGNGYLWMTVANHDAGVVRFDGKNWKYFHTGNAEGLITNNVRGIATNKSGNVWFATTKGITNYDGTTFKTQLYNKDLGRKIADNLNPDGTLNVSGLTVEDNGAFWIATQDKGVMYSNNKFSKNLDPSNSLLNSAAVLKTFVDKENRKWFVTGTPNSYWYYVYHNKRQRINFTSNAGGLTVLKENEHINDPNWVMFTDKNSDLKLGNTFSIGEDKEGNIWMPTTGDGLLKIKDEAITIADPNDKWANLTKGYIADDGNIYLATTMKGVKVYKEGKIEEYHKWPNMGGVNDMTLDKDNVFWVTGTGGVSRWVNNDWETFNKKNGDLPTVIFYCILKDSKGMLWVGSAKGLMKYDGTTWTVISKKEVPFPSDDITALAEAKDGKLWVGTKSGISIFDGTNWTHISKIETPKINKFWVTCISFDKNGNAWMGTEFDGLLKYDGSTWKQYNTETTHSMHNKIHAVKVGTDNKIYFMSEEESLFGSATSFGMGTGSMAQEYQLLSELNDRVKAADPKYIFSIVSDLQ